MLISDERLPKLKYLFLCENIGMPIIRKIYLPSSTFSTTNILVVAYTDRTAHTQTPEKEKRQMKTFFYLSP